MALLLLFSLSTVTIRVPNRLTSLVEAPFISVPGELSKIKPKFSLSLVCRLLNLSIIDWCSGVRGVSKRRKEKKKPRRGHKFLQRAPGLVHAHTPQNIPTKRTTCISQSGCYHQKPEYEGTLIDSYVSVVDAERRTCRLDGLFFALFLFPVNRRHPLSTMFPLIWNLSTIKPRFSLSSGCQPLTLLARSGPVRREISLAERDTIIFLRQLLPTALLLLVFCRALFCRRAAEDVVSFIHPRTRQRVNVLSRNHFPELVKTLHYVLHMWFAQQCP